MTIHRRRRIRVPVYEPEIQSTHEVDGSNFPEGMDEVDATEGLPNALDTLQEVPSSPPGSLLDMFPLITMKQGSQIGKTAIVPADTTGSIPPTEILAVRTEDDLNTVFAVTFQQKPIDERISGPLDWQVPDGALGSVYTPPMIIAQFGAGSCQFIAKLDCVRGQTVAFRGSFLRILAVNYTNAPDIEIGAFISLLPPSVTLPPTKTATLGMIPDGGTQNMSIPPFAKTVKVMRAPAATTLRIYFQNRDPGGVVIAETVVAASAECPEVEVPATADRMYVQNTSVGTHLTGGFAIFKLSL